MIHFLPDPDQCQPAAGAIRIVGLDRALNVVAQLAGEPETRRAGLADAWAGAGEAQRQLLDDWSDRAASASAAALEAIAALQAMGLEANPAALRRLADTIRGDLESMGAILSL